MAYFYLSYPELLQFCQNVFQSYGFEEKDSASIAEILLAADLNGIESHGVQRLVRYDYEISSGLVDLNAHPQITYETPLSAVVDAKNAMGQLTAKYAMELAIKKAKNGWSVLTDGETYTAPYVLITVGGAAAPALGGAADGYRLLTDHGCRKTPLFPSIVQLRTATDFVRAVKGIRVDAALRLCLNGREVATQTGEVLFTDYGISGPAVMYASRPAADWERQKKGDLTAHLDLLPDWSLADLTARVAARGRLPGRTLEDLLTGLVHKRVGQTILRVAGVLPLTRPADSLTETEAAQIAAVLKDWVIPVTGTQGFGGAQVTAGGIAADEVDHATMAVKRLPGVYAAGEVLDVDGDCGGFNLQFAWSSAYVAAKAIGKKL